MAESKDPKKQVVTIVTDGGTVIVNSVGPVHHGSGDQINTFISTRPANPNQTK